MACSVPGSARFRATTVVLALASLGGHFNSMQAQATRCSLSGLAGAPPARQKQVREFQQRVEDGPIYKELLLRLGEPERCGAKLSGENIALSYAFRNEAHLDASISPGIEYSEQHAQLRGLNEEKALALLQQSEQDSFGQDGCGIDWNRPESESKEEHSSSRAVVFRGASCNCQARILYRGKAVVGLALKSSC
jgi:hypothetical protein